jgi:hypothetical protein
MAMPAPAGPAYSALHSERAILLPSLNDALARYVQARSASSSTGKADGAAHYASQ